MKIFIYQCMFGLSNEIKSLTFQAKEGKEKSLTKKSNEFIILF